MSDLFCWSDECVHSHFSTYGEMFLKVSLPWALILAIVIVGGLFLWAWLTKDKR
jgi:hypothetical protein